MNKNQMTRNELRKIRLYEEFDRITKEIKDIANKKNINLSNLYKTPKVDVFLLVTILVRIKIIKSFSEENISIIKLELVVLKFIFFYSQILLFQQSLLNHLKFFYDLIFL